MTDQQGTYPTPAFSFVLRSADPKHGMEARFAEISGLNAPTTADRSQDGAPSGVRHLSVTQPQGLEMTHGQTAVGQAFAKWCEDSLGAQLQPRDFTVSLLDAEGTAVMAWDVAGCIVQKFEPAGLLAIGGVLAIAQCDMSVNSITRKAV